MIIHDIIEDVEETLLNPVALPIILDVFFDIGCSCNPERMSCRSQRWFQHP